MIWKESCFALFFLITLLNCNRNLSIFWMMNISSLAYCNILPIQQRDLNASTLAVQDLEMQWFMAPYGVVYKTTIFTSKSIWYGCPLAVDDHCTSIWLWNALRALTVLLLTGIFCDILDNLFVSLYWLSQTADKVTASLDSSFEILRWLQWKCIVLQNPHEENNSLHWDTKINWNWLSFSFPFHCAKGIQHTYWV